MAPITQEETLSTTKTSPASPKGGKRTVTKTSKSKKYWKKPKGMPKKPLSAYNLFFQDIKIEESEKQKRDTEKRNMYYAKAEKEKDKYTKAMAEWYSNQNSLHSNTAKVGMGDSFSVASAQYANGSLSAPSKLEAQSIPAARMNSSPARGPAYNSKRFLPPSPIVSSAGAVADKARMNQAIKPVSNLAPAQALALGSKRFVPPSSLVPSFGAAVHRTRMNQVAAAVSNLTPAQGPAFGSKTFVPPSSLVPSAGSAATQKRVNHHIKAAISNSLKALAQDPVLHSERFVPPPSLLHSAAAHRHASSKLPLGLTPCGYGEANLADDRASKLRSLVTEARKERLVSEACEEYCRRDYLKRRSELMVLADMCSDERPIYESIERGNIAPSSALNTREHLASVPLASAVHNTREHYGSVPLAPSNKSSGGRPRKALLVTYSVIPMP